MCDSRAIRRSTPNPGNDTEPSHILPNLVATKQPGPPFAASPEATRIRVTCGPDRVMCSPPRPSHVRLRPSFGQPEGSHGRGLVGYLVGQPRRHILALLKSRNWRICRPDRRRWPAPRGGSPSGRMGHSNHRMGSPKRSYGSPRPSYGRSPVWSPGPTRSRIARQRPESDHEPTHGRSPVWRQGPTTLYRSSRSENDRRPSQRRSPVLRPDPQPTYDAARSENDREPVAWAKPCLAGRPTAFVRTLPPEQNTSRSRPSGMELPDYPVVALTPHRRTRMGPHFRFPPGLFSDS
jgi:hypothetical protein